VRFGRHVVTVVVAWGQFLDVIESCSAAGLCGWLAAMPSQWRNAIGWAVLDLSGRWRLVFDTMPRAAGQVAGPFHLVKLAHERPDDVRRRVEHETLGRRGQKDDPLYRSRRLLTKADERLDDRPRTKLLGLLGLLGAGDPCSEVCRLARQRDRRRLLGHRRPRARSRVCPSAWS